MIAGATSCFQNSSQGLQMYGLTDHNASASMDTNSGAETHSGAFLYSLSVLKDKVHQMQSLAGVIISPASHNQSESEAIAIASMGTLIQEIMVTASSMMFNCQQLSLGTSAVTNQSNHEMDHHHQQRCVNKVPTGGLPQNSSTTHEAQTAHQIGEESGRGFFTAENLDWYADNYHNNSSSSNTGHANHGNNTTTTTTNNNNHHHSTISTTTATTKPATTTTTTNNKSKNNKNMSESNLERELPNWDGEIIELDAADLLAKYTHYCQVCGKGFKRDANLRMHMRAHGDKYKSSAALSNPLKNSGDGEGGKGFSSVRLARKYSCPQEGCRWNRNHAKFQPLKSMICVKNHYKRSHCPKMYVCNRCNQKQFSVLSDLRTHEKHCGELKWQCSCGTTFSRKDKLMGHVALFTGHSPAGNFCTKSEKIDHYAVQMQ